MYMETFCRRDLVCRGIEWPKDCLTREKLSLELT